MKIFITGSSGYIGSNILNYLSKFDHYEITCLEHIKKNHPRPKNVKFVNGNILEIHKLENYIKNIDVFIHLAAEVQFSNADKFFNVNYISLKNILKTCNENNVKKFIYFGTRGTRGNFLEPEKTTETSDFLKLTKADNYLKSKIMAEKFIHDFRKNSNMNIINIMPTSVLGGINFKQTLLSKFIKNKINRKLIFYFSGGLNIIHIESLLDGLNKLLNANIINEDFFFSGVNISFLDFFKKINKTYVKNTLYVKTPDFIILAIVLLFEKIRFIINLNLNMTYYKAKINLNFGTYCNNDKARKIITLPNPTIDEIISKINKLY